MRSPQALEADRQRLPLSPGLVSVPVWPHLPVGPASRTAASGIWAQRGAAAPRRPLHVTAAAAADSGSWSEAPGATPRDGATSTGGSRTAPAGFASLERLLASQMGGGPGGDWREVEGCYVLYPPEGAPPRCLIQFIGGSFVGAAPQLAYRPLLEALAARGALVRMLRPGSWQGAGAVSIAPGLARPECCSTPAPLLPLAGGHGAAQRAQQLLAQIPLPECVPLLLRCAPVLGRPVLQCQLSGPTSGQTPCRCRSWRCRMLPALTSCGWRMRCTSATSAA